MPTRKRTAPDALHYPAMLRMMIGVGFACAAAFCVLLLSPLLLSYGSILGIPQLVSLTAFLNASAIVVLITSLPLGWTLSLAGLALDWLTRRKVGRKVKRNSNMSAIQKSRTRLGMVDRAPSLARLVDRPVDGARNQPAPDSYRGRRDGLLARE